MFKNWRLLTFIFFFVMSQFMACSSQNDFVEPTTDLSINFINLPQAWKISKGENVHIGVVRSENDTVIDWVAKTAELAPKAKVTGISKIHFLSSISQPVKYNVVLILESFNPTEYSEMLKAIEHYTKRKVTIILPAYFGPMKGDYDYSGWRAFVRQESEMGAIVVGAHGNSYQLGNLSFWRNIPEDVFAFHRDIGGPYFDSDALIKENLEESAYLVAGVAALMVSKDPDISPAQIKRQFREKGRKIKWVVTENRKTAYPTWNGRTMDEFEKNIKSSKIIETFEGSCLDAGLALGLEPLVEGQWCLQVLNVKEAQKTATGKGITVAILDWLFVKDTSTLRDRIIKPGSVVADSIFHPDNPIGHGNWMAEELVKVAPDVKIMPVRIHTFKEPDDYWKTEYPRRLIKAIDYSITNGADVISISQPPVPDEWQEKLDEVVQKAADAGVTMVYIHYYGKRRDVVVPHPIEFARSSHPLFEGREFVYVVGTGFLDETSFPNTWGFSETAPIVAGVVAMMKEINPKLKPAEIREILLTAGKPIKSGYKMLDAVKTLQGAR